ncbi:helix-turn-helix transcriptional regulator [Sphingomonas baiyangensis]|uniref:AlpA family transcriptional regulator n=1 Tax=Sphingomonas baiyangensis TaxID=2572576 RepID=A0A4U1L637_9SPHN|nr:AlpA family transcriptional regulator [Sphingomonas baiyangensis]TKD52064.1 AlpA family transcriptional regulator [Sphingomonas baiyangensis]
MQLLRLPDVMARTALSRSAVYDLMAAGQFPRPVKIGGRLNAWPNAEIDAWIETRIAAREAA